MNQDDFILMICRAVLCGRQLHGTPLPHDLFAAAMKTADEQTVSGLLTSTLMDPRHGVTLSKPDIAEAWAVNKSIVERNKLVREQLKALCLMFQQHGVKFVVVKGATIGQLYPDRDVRASGDIDFYLDADNFSKARQLVTDEWEVEIEDGDEGDDEQHVLFYHEDVLFEMHFCLLKFASSSVQRVFDRMIAGSTVTFRTIDGVEVPILAPAEELVYTFLHLYHHFIELGIGLRQICDMAVLLSSFPTDAEMRKSVRTLLQQLGFTLGFQVFEAICVDRLGVDEDKLPVAIDDKARSYQAAALDVVFKHGNFGQYGRHTAVRSGVDYYCEALTKKVKQYWRFYRLSPSEARAVFLCNIPKKIFLAIRRTVRNK